MGKVKKSGEVTDVRRAAKRLVVEKVKGTPPRRSTRKPKTVRAARGERGQRKPAKARGTLKKVVEKEVPVIRYRVRELEPQDKCGPGTTVQQLYRVDESGNGPSRVHLVFFDRHGWYCEHDRDCPAVIHAKRIGSKRKPLDGFNNGRTRA